MGSEKVLGNENMLTVDVNTYPDIGYGRIEEVFLVYVFSHIRDPVHSGVRVEKQIPSPPLTK